MPRSSELRAMCDAKVSVRRSGLDYLVDRIHLAGGAASGEETEYRSDLWRRYRPDQRQRVFDGIDGLPYAEYRPARQRGDDLYRLLCGAELYCGPVQLHHRPGNISYGPQ